MCHHVPWSVPTVVRHLQNGSSKTENHKGSSSIAIALRCLDFLISYNVFRLRSLLRFQDFAVLLASPNNCHGVSCVGTFGGNPANVDCVTIDYCTKYMYVELLTFCKVSKATWTFPWGDTRTKGTGVLVPNFGKKPLKGNKILFCGRGLNFFLP